MNSNGSTAAAVYRGHRTTLMLLLIFDVLLIGFTLAKGSPTIWHEFDREKNLWTFGNSIQAVLVAVVAYVNFLLLSSRRSRGAWIWAFFACAFLFFGFDDMLLLHERGGHAVENALPVVSRSNITIYMDDIFQLGYVAVGAVFGLAFLRRTARGHGAMKYYMWGVAAVLTATLIGLNPSMKSIPFPLALIQILHLASLYMFAVSFTAVTAAELTQVSSGVRSGSGRSATIAVS